jgi:hypothetical protein
MHRIRALVVMCPQAKLVLATYLHVTAQGYPTRTDIYINQPGCTAGLLYFVCLSTHAKSRTYYLPPPSDQRETQCVTRSSYQTFYAFIYDCRFLFSSTRYRACRKFMGLRRKKRIKVSAIRIITLVNLSAP